MNEHEKKIIESVSRLAREKSVPVYLVGGYLRDRVLRRVSHDLDFVVEGDAVSFARLASRRLALAPPVVYSRFGTAMIRSGRLTLEFAAARRESYLPDSRKPRVAAADIHEDLRRRDFTINAMALSLADGVKLDPFGGRADLKQGIIRTPIDPGRTFHDDPLRMLRAVRFAARFNFRIAEETARAVISNSGRLKIVSRERVAGEILQMMADARPASAILLLDRLKLLPLVLPEVDKLKRVVAANDRDCKDVFRHTLIVLDRVSARTRDQATRLAALFHDIGKPDTQRYVPGEGWTFHDHPLVGARIFGHAARRLGIGAPVRAKAAKLIEYHLRPHYLAGAGVDDGGATSRAVGHLVRDAGHDMESLFILARADLTSRNERKVEKGVADIDRLAGQVADWKRKQRAAVFKLAIDGNDIMDIMGLPPGPEVGRVKSALEKLVLENNLPNRKRDLKKHLREQFRDSPAESPPGGKRA